MIIIIISYLKPYNHVPIIHITSKYLINRIINVKQQDCNITKDDN